MSGAARLTTGASRSRDRRSGVLESPGVRRCPAGQHEPGIVLHRGVYQVKKKRLCAALSSRRPRSTPPARGRRPRGSVRPTPRPREGSRRPHEPKSPRGGFFPRLRARPASTFDWPSSAKVRSRPTRQGWTAPAENLRAQSSANAANETSAAEAETSWMLRFRAASIKRTREIEGNQMTSDNADRGCGWNGDE